MLQLRILGCNLHQAHNSETHSISAAGLRTARRAMRAACSADRMLAG